jgi:KipI family sensor histidine kinase inhibitor
LNDPSLTARPLGDTAITISFGEERSAQLLARIHAAARAVRHADIEFVDDIVPAYLALTVFYDPRRASYDQIAQRALTECEGAVAGRGEGSREHVIPVKYDGLDLEQVAATTGLSIDAVIARHAGRTYSVDLLGFVPGFAYLSELDPALQLPRRAQPRPRVAAGSVAIAGAQTGVYPLDTPGGWHIIGNTTVAMFDAARDAPALLAAGDTVRFEPIR